MDRACFEPRLDADDAAGRVDHLTFATLARSALRSLFGRSDDDADPTVSVRYYPDYLAYTTVTLRRVGRGDREERFIAAVDAVTGRVGEVDLTLPDVETRKLAERRVVPVELDPADAEEQWEEWLFPYVNRTYRPIKRPETALDSLDLVYTPYYVVDYGPEGNCYAVSGLTEQVELIEDLPPLAATYCPETG